MGYINLNSQAIHLDNQLASKIRQSFFRSAFFFSISQFTIAEKTAISLNMMWFGTALSMSQADRPNAKAIVQSQNIQITSQPSRIFQSHQKANFPFAFGFFYLCNTLDHSQNIRMRFHFSVDLFDNRQRIRGIPIADHKKLYIQPTFLHPRQVGMIIFITLSEIKR